MRDQLIIENLTVRYGETVVVKDLSLRVEAGALVTLLGPSGCGKTTILRCIAGLERCGGGTIRIGDRIVAGPNGETPPERRNVNMVFQSYAIWPHMTVIENVSFGLKLMKLPPADVRRRAGQALELVGLSKYANRYGTELSGGQQQRVALARAIVTEPELLLFDEPLSNLDAALREAMRIELRELHERLGTTAIYVTHDQTEALVMSDRVILIRDGRIVQEGTPRDVFERPSSRFAAEFLGVANIWDGVVSDVGPSGEVSISLDQDKSVVRIHASGATHCIGTRGAIGVRAERIAVSASPIGVDGLTWKGQIQRVSYLGSCVRYDVKVGDRIVRSDAHPRTALVPGDEVWLEIDPSDAVWLAVRDDIERFHL